MSRTTTALKTTKPAVAKFLKSVFDAGRKMQAIKRLPHDFGLHSLQPGRQARCVKPSAADVLCHHPKAWVTFSASREQSASGDEKYYALLRGAGIVQLEPAPQYNTFEVFTFPWIE